MRPPSKHRQENIQTKEANKEPTIFKTQGQSYNMEQLVMSTLLKENVLDTIAPHIYSKISTEIQVQLKNIIRSAVTEAVAEAIAPLLHTITAQDEKIKQLEQKNADLENANETLRQDLLNLDSTIEELEQYGRRTTLRFHNVPMKVTDLQCTDKLIVKLVKGKMKVVNFTEDDINRSHIIGEINDEGKGQIICRLRNWKLKNLLYQSKRFLKDNSDKIFVTEDLTRYRQTIIRELNKLKKANRVNSFWTLDGRIFVKTTYESPKQLIKCIDDIKNLDLAPPPPNDLAQPPPNSESGV